jgi:phosphatidylglycerophosphatase A
VPEAAGPGIAAPHAEPPSFLVRCIATGCYTGMIPWASGTFGTLVGLLIALLPGCSSPLVLGPLALVGFFAGVITSRRVAAWTGHRLTASAALAKSTFQKQSTHETADPSIVVIDEIVGMWITLLWLPFTPVSLVLAFVAFRVMDIVKPEPARLLERIPEGWGIMLDDVVAGVYANILCQIVVRFLLPG